MSTRVWQSTIINAPIAKVWSIVRPLDFVYLPRVSTVDLEGKGTHPDQVGAERIVWYVDQTQQRLRLLELSDSRHEITWELVSSDPPTIVLSSIHTIRLRRVSENNSTFVEWTTDFSRDASADVIEDARFKQKENFAALAVEAAKKFNFKSTADQVAQGYDGKGKVVVVTGASAGLGVETTRIFLKAKAHVVAAVRDVNKAKAAFAEIVKQYPESKLTILPLDLASFKSIRAFVTQFRALNLPIHILINNAGVMAVKNREVTEQKIELQFGTNHVGHHLLTTLLLDIIKKSAPSRIVSLSSGAHRLSGINFDDWNAEKNYNKWVAYGQSKTANILFAKQLDALLKKENVQNVTSLSLHPGVIATELTRGFDNSDFVELSQRHFRIKTTEQGTATTIVAAISPDLEGRGGVYLESCNECAPLAHAADMGAAQRLWDLTESIIQKNP